jgi:hypothetical protein
MNTRVGDDYPQQLIGELNLISGKVHVGDGQFIPGDPSFIGILDAGVYEVWVKVASTEDGDRVRCLWMVRPAFITSQKVEAGSTWADTATIGFCDSSLAEPVYTVEQNDEYLDRLWNATESAQFAAFTPLEGVIEKVFVASSGFGDGDFLVEYLLDSQGSKGGLIVTFFKWGQLFSSE